MKITLAFLLLILSAFNSAFSQIKELGQDNIVWTSQSKNAGESMPCGGGDIGLNVWVENGDLFFYISRSGTFDENNAFLKLGRVRIKLLPNPFAGSTFRQELNLKDGNVIVSGANGDLSTQVKIWVDVFRPVIHVSVKSSQAVKTEVGYESWRYQDHIVKGKENNENSWKFAPQGEIKTLKDQISFDGYAINFYHHNQDTTVFDATVRQQGLSSVKSSFYNPLPGLTFGGAIMGDHLKPAGTYYGKYADTDFEGWKLQSSKASKTQEISICLNTQQVKNVADWQTGLQQRIFEARNHEKTAEQTSLNWWHQFWDRSYIFISPGQSTKNRNEWQAGRNYQLFRYMLGCNAYGEWPTKFNGGLFTVDSRYTDTTLKYTPDFRNWGGGLMTAQNQRLVYFPMIKSGDWNMMRPQFDFYLRSLRNAELRTETYWGHQGATFTEQLENFGLPNSAEYTWKRPAGYDKGMEYNAWLEYEWDTVFQFCLMILETERYNNSDIHQYIPLIESCLTFYNEHYQYLAKQRGSKAFDAAGHLILYPGSAGETYKMAYNSTTTIAALETILNRLLALPAGYLNEQQRKDWTALLSRIPPISFRNLNGHQTISPAALWERVNNSEAPQLYPVFPWGIYGVGKPGLDIAVNTFKYDPDVLKFRSHIGWKQDNIFAADLGLTQEAAQLNVLKMKDSGRRFPAFWGPGFDWTPDHNWGGSGMIGLQEMLLQTDDKKILLFPAWPKEWDVHFKLHAPYQTTVEATLKGGKVTQLVVLPESRRKDVVVMLDGVVE